MAAFLTRPLSYINHHGGLCSQPLVEWLGGMARWKSPQLSVVLEGISEAPFGSFSLRQVSDPKLAPLLALTSLSIVRNLQAL